MSYRCPICGSERTNLKDMSEAFNHTAWCPNAPKQKKPRKPNRAKGMNREDNKQGN